MRPASSRAPKGQTKASGTRHPSMSIPNDAVGGSKPGGQGRVGAGRFNAVRPPTVSGPGKNMTPRANGNEPFSTINPPGVPADAVYHRSRSGKTSSKPAPDAYPT